VRAFIQRVRWAEVEVEGEIVGRIEQGLLTLLGVARGDDPAVTAAVAEKLCRLRVFSDDAGKMNLSLAEVGGSMLVVSQFTLMADCRKGRRPSFDAAAPPEQARRLYERFIEQVAACGVPVASGRFQADMQVRLENDGPVSLLVELP
jgi:D-aminoacyl-tRNA deacylase